MWPSAPVTTILMVGFAGGSDSRDRLQVTARMTGEEQAAVDRLVDHEPIGFGEKRGHGGGRVVATPPGARSMELRRNALDDGIAAHDALALLAERRNRAQLAQDMLVSVIG